MKGMLYAVFLVFHLASVFQLAFPLPVSVELERRVKQLDPESFKRQVYINEKHPPKNGRYPPLPDLKPTFYHKEVYNRKLEPHEVNHAAKQAYDLIMEKETRDRIKADRPDALLVAALHVPHKKAIYFASQPVGSGHKFFSHRIEKNQLVPAVLNEHPVMHAEGHAIYKATKDGANLQGAYVAVHGRFSEKEQPKLQNPCHGDPRTKGVSNCMVLLKHLKINHILKPEDFEAAHEPHHPVASSSHHVARRH
ncbi:hypothetical protein CVT26_009077 [Gymnopilus dilepis]|uniref:Uncharacterized protein n=1 Tax=Gymnopilus dilepis TaxID=231916 RepID=A0A409YB35_9AGAR|nr:hypothetical protein CVT26_009077 [Gymnopilus dilepis]